MLGWGERVGLLLWLWHMSIIVNETFRETPISFQPKGRTKRWLTWSDFYPWSGRSENLSMKLLWLRPGHLHVFYIDQFVQSVTNEHLLPSCPPHNEPPPVVIQSRQPSNSWREQLSKMSPLEHTVTDDTTKTWVEQLERWCDTLVG